MNHVIETVIFKLNSGVSEADFLAAAQPTFDYLKTVPGYLKRELSVTSEGQWLDIVHWSDMESALKAADELMTHPVGQAFGALIDFSTTTMFHAAPKLSS